MEKRIYNADKKTKDALKFLETIRKNAIDVNKKTNGWKSKEWIYYDGEGTLVATDGRRIMAVKANGFQAVLGESTGFFTLKQDFLIEEDISLEFPDWKKFFQKTSDAQVKRLCLNNDLKFKDTDMDYVLYHACSMVNGCLIDPSFIKGLGKLPLDTIWSNGIHNSINIIGSNDCIEVKYVVMPMRYQWTEILKDVEI